MRPNYRPKSTEDLQRMANAIRAKSAAFHAEAKAGESARLRNERDRQWRIERSRSFRKAGLTYKEIARRTGLSMSEARAATAGIRLRSVRGHYNVRSRPAKWPFGAGNDNSTIGLINKAVPKNLDEDLRQEVCQELALMLIDGTVSEIELAGHVEAVIQSVKKFDGYCGGGISALSLDYAYPWTHSPIKELI